MYTHYNNKSNLAAANCIIFDNLDKLHDPRNLITLIIFIILTPTHIILMLQILNLRASCNNLNNFHNTNTYCPKNKITVALKSYSRNIKSSSDSPNNLWQSQSSDNFHNTTKPKHQHGDCQGSLNYSLLFVEKAWECKKRSRRYKGFVCFAFLFSTYLIICTAAKQSVQHFSTENTHIFRVPGARSPCLNFRLPVVPVRRIIM